MGVNKVEYGGEVLVDLTEDTVTEDTLAEGVTAHNAAGEQITGRMASAASGDYIPVPATAEVGQTIRVSEVDENGKPTAWEAVDFPSGGGETWETIADITTTEEVTAVNIENDVNGEAFSLIEADIHIIIVTTPTNTADSALQVRTNINKAAGGATSTAATRMFRNGDGSTSFKTGLTLNSRAGGIQGQMYQLGNTMTAIAGYANYSYSSLTALFLSGGTFGVGSRIIVKGVRA